MPNPDAAATRRSKADPSPANPAPEESVPAAYTHSTPVRVRYAETDQMGVVYHSNFIIWFEVGRVELLRQLGFSYRQMEQDGCRLPVVEVRCRYKEPARYDEELVVKTRVQRVRSNLIHFVYEVTRAADGVLLAEGETIHLTQGLDGSRRVFPPQYKEALRRVAGR